MQALLADDEILVGHVVLDPGERLPKAGNEVHVAQSETIVVLRGEVVVRTDLGVDRVHIFAQSPSAQERFAQAFIPAGTAHWVENQMAHPAEYIAILRKVPT